MASLQKRLGSFLIGLYAWVLAISFGLVLLDVLYTRLVPGATFAFSEVADFLLLVSLVTLIAAVVALAFSRKSKAVRNLIIASQLILLLEIFIPTFFSMFKLNMQALAVGPWIRVILSGAASILAFIALYRYNRQK